MTIASNVSPQYPVTPAWLEVPEISPKGPVFLHVRNSVAIPSYVSPQYPVTPPWVEVSEISPQGPLFLYVRTASVLNTP